MITNPPYGERLNDEHLLELYAMIGERLKHAFKGGQAWIISYRFECFDKIGLKPSAKIPLLNGQLPCELRKYEIFDGRYNDFRGKGAFLDKTEPVTRRGQTLRHKAREKERLQMAGDGIPETARPSGRKPFQNREEETGQRPFRKTGEGRPFRKESSFGKSSGERTYHKENGFRKESPKSFRNEGEQRPFRKDNGTRTFHKDGEQRQFRKEGSFRKEGGFRTEKGPRKDGGFRKDGNRTSAPQRNSGFKGGDNSHQFRKR